MKDQSSSAQRPYAPSLLLDMCTLHDLRPTRCILSDLGEKHIGRHAAGLRPSLSKLGHHLRFAQNLGNFGVEPVNDLFGRASRRREPVLNISFVFG